VVRFGLAALASVAVVHGCASASDPGALVPPTADQDPALPQIAMTVAGRTRAVHVETYGEPSSPPLLVLHGSLSDLRALRMFAELSDRYFVVLWDQRGNGLSERIGADEYTFESVDEEIRLMVGRYGGGRPATLIGHSFGAMYATMFTARHPTSVDQLVLAEPAGLTGQIFGETADQILDVDLLEPDMNRMFWQNEVLSPRSHEAMDYRALMMLLSGRQTRYFCHPDAPPRWPVWRPGAYVEYLRGLRMGTGGGFATPRFDFDFVSGIERYRDEVLILAGSCSALGPAFQARHHVPLFPSARLVTIEPAGHRMFVEQPDAVLDAVRGYLRAYVVP
jgi:proline iminopeptidase